MSLPVSVRESYYVDILGKTINQTLLPVWDFNREGEVETDYGNLEKAFVEIYGKEVGEVLFEDICDGLDVEQIVYQEYVADCDSRRADAFQQMGISSESLYDQLEQLNSNLYQRTA